MADGYNDMIYAASADEIEKKRKAFLRKWRLRCQAVAECLEEPRDRLFTFTKLPVSQWKSARTTNVRAAQPTTERGGRLAVTAPPPFLGP